MFEAYSFWWGFASVLMIVGVGWISWYVAPLEHSRPRDKPL